MSEKSLPEKSLWGPSPELLKQRTGRAAELDLSGPKQLDHKGLSHQSDGFSSSHVWMRELDHKES